MYNVCNSLTSEHKLTSISWHAIEISGVDFSCILTESEFYIMLNLLNKTP